jgi:hypothetical protein
LDAGTLTANHLNDPDRILLSWLRESEIDRVNLLVLDRIDEVLALLHPETDYEVGDEEWVPVGGTNVSLCLMYHGITEHAQISMTQRAAFIWTQAAIVGTSST